MTERQPTYREIQRMSAHIVSAAEKGNTDEAIGLLERGADPDAVDENGVPALVWSARRGDMRLIDELLRRGAKPDSADGKGTTPLMWAVREGQDAAVERLLAAGADVRLTDTRETTALHYAAAHGRNATVERLLPRGADRDAVDGSDDTPLTLAAAGAHFDIVLSLAAQGADINAQGNGGRTALLQAVMESRIPAGDDKARLVAELLSHGADPEIADDYGWTPLMRAAHAGDDAVIGLLLDRRADIHRPDAQGMNAFHWAAQAGKTGAMRLLLDRGANVDRRDSQGQTALFRQMRDPNAETVRFLLVAGADPNARADRGDSVLMAAVRKQNQAMAALLLDHGAAIDAPGRNGETPLDLALASGMDSMAHFLVQRGARASKQLADSLNLHGGIDDPDDRGWTPLGKAARDNDVSRIHVLLDAGANIEGTADDGVTPLMVAAVRSNPATLTALLERGANANARDSHGETVLHHAIAGQRVENVPLILAAGADVDSAGGRGRTPLMAATAQYDNEIAGMLLDSGADVDRQDEQGRTALMVAVSSRNEEMVARLLALGADAAIQDHEQRTAAEIAHGLHEPVLARRVAIATAPTPESAKPAPPDTRQWPVPDSVMERLAAMFPEEPDSVPPRPIQDACHPAGFVLDANREVDCDCDVTFHRPVYRDHTGINFRVTACLRCGTVSVTESIVDEPHPNDVRCVGHIIQAVSFEALEWLADWPRLAWGVWNDDRSIYLPAALRCQTVEGLEQAERAALAEQKGMPVRERILHAGVPSNPAPTSLPDPLESFAETWEGLRLTDDTPIERLWALSDDGTWAAPFAHAILLRQPNIVQETASRLRSADPTRSRAAKCLVDRQRLNDPAIVAAVIDRVRDAPLTESALGPLLDTLYFIGPAAAEARPLLRELAQRVGGSDYYFRKRIEQVRDLLKPGPGSP